MGCCSVQWQHPPHWSTSPSWRCGLGHRRSSRDRSIPRYTLANVSIDHIVAVTTQKSTKWRKKKMSEGFNGVSYSGQNLCVALNPCHHPCQAVQYNPAQSPQLPSHCWLQRCTLKNKCSSLVQVKSYDDPKCHVPKHIVLESQSKWKQAKPYVGKQHHSNGSEWSGVRSWHCLS